jgi:integrase
MPEAQNMSRQPFLQLVRGKFRVRIVVPAELRPHLPAPHTGKANLVKGLGTGNEREAARLAIPWIAEFGEIIAKTKTRITGLSELAAIDRLPLHEQFRQGPAVVRRFFASLNMPLGVSEGGAAKVVPFDTIIPLWAKHTNAPKKGIDEMTSKCRRFIEALGHDNMAAVTFPDCRDYRDGMIEEGELSSGSILNHLKLLKSIFTYGFDNEYIPVNHMARVKYSAGDRVERDDFTPEERRRTLTSARAAPLHIYWCNWLCSFHGFRTSEVADASCREIECADDGGIWIINMHRKHRSKDQRLKTPVSTRGLALHQAVLDEGFLDYWRRLPQGGPLFPGKLDSYGKRAGPVATECSIWLRYVVKISDPNKPFYSHRHTATSFLRNTLAPDGSPAVKEDIERYILGHAGKGAHAGYGKQWFQTLKSAVEVIPNPL